MTTQAALQARGGAYQLEIVISLTLIYVYLALLEIALHLTPH
jgi:hypothetical protein